VFAHESADRPSGGVSAHGALPAEHGWVYADGNGDTVFLQVG
jgi:hypothetical protein